MKLHEPLLKSEIDKPAYNSFISIKKTIYVMKNLASKKVLLRSTLTAFATISITK